MHQELFVGIAFQDWLFAEAFIPGLLYDCCSGARLSLVQRGDAFKVDLLVEIRLQGRFKVMGMVVPVSVVVSVSVPMVMVMTVIMMRSHILLDCQPARLRWGQDVIHLVHLSRLE